jgi:anion transporter
LEELLARHPSLSLHFCTVLSRRLAVMDKDVSRGRAAFNLVMEESFAALSPRVQDFLIRTSILKTLDLGAIQSVLSISEPMELLTNLSSNHPTFLRSDQKSGVIYPGYLRDFLMTKLQQTMGREERNELHIRFAAYFSSRAQWGSAIYHYINAEAWERALDLIESHEKELLEGEPPKEILRWLDSLPAELARPRGDLARLRAEAQVRLGDLDAAVRSYQDFLAEKQVSASEAIDMARYYQELAELHRKRGELGEALGCLHQAGSVLENGRPDLEVVDAMRSMEALQEERGLRDAAVRWGLRTLSVTQKLSRQSGSIILPRNRVGIGLFFALAAGLAIWHMPPQPFLDERGVRFLATLTACVILWMLEVFEEYVVAVLLLLSWLIFNIVPTHMALAGFSKSEWLFVLGILGIGAAVTKSGLLYRVALEALRRMRPSYRLYTLVFSASGLVATPLLPEAKGRIAIIAPLAQTISEALGFKPRSNGSAGLVLSAYCGLSQMTFMFLTGATVCLVGWNLLPEPAKAEFGWGVWLLAALPAGIFFFLCLFASVHVLFRLENQDWASLSPKTLDAQLEVIGPLTKGEWLSLAVIALALAGWLGKPLHGVSESSVALGAFLIFLLSGVLDKKGLRNNVNWGYLLFLGVISSLSGIIPHLNVERWLLGFIEPVLSSVSFAPVLFLIFVTLLVYALRFFLKKTPAVILLLLTLVPLAQDMGIHPGVLLLSILMAIESWFLPYQTDSYQIAYYSTDETAFSHIQARKLMMVKFVVSLLAVALSVPYWRMLGFIR